MKLLVGIALIFLLGVLAVAERHQVMYQVMKLALGEPPELLEAVDEGENVRWFDDYYTIEEIAPDTWAIGEPRYYQLNYNYLVVGTERALLFDAGPGVRDIRPVIESLTGLPLVFMPSHFHYDHVGNGILFDERAVVDLPYLRERAEGNRLAFTDMEHLGPVEGFDIPTWDVTHWWAPGDEIDLGNRVLSVIHTPGHSPESISLYDPVNQFVFAGDYLYPGIMFAFTPGGSASQYLESAETLVNEFTAVSVYYSAHRVEPPGAPTLSQEDVIALRNTLRAIRDGSTEGEWLWPRSYKINENMSILVDPLEDWEEQ